VPDLRVIHTFEAVKPGAGRAQGPEGPESPERPAGPRPAQAVMVYCFDKQGRLLLIRDLKPGRGWGVPGGRIEKGETALEAAHREVMEEAAVAISDPLIFGYEEIMPASPVEDKARDRNGDSDRDGSRDQDTGKPGFAGIVAVFQAHTSEVKPFRPNAEVAERRFVPPDEAQALVQFGTGGAGTRGTPQQVLWAALESYRASRDQSRGQSQDQPDRQPE